jgi:Flp pilus assembly pilin Flp
MTARAIQNGRGWSGRRLARTLARLHRDERGYTMLDYAMVFGFVVVPLILLFGKMFELITAYFSMIGFYATWPFL